MEDSELYISTWGRIAKFLGVTPQTARKYYRRFGLPIYKMPSGIPVAFKDQIRLWVIRFDEIKKEKSENP